MKQLFSIFVLACLPFLGKAQGLLSIVVTGHDAKCNGSIDGSAVVTASGGSAPYTYAWAPATATADSVGGLAAGVYSVTVTDSAGHSAAATITISQPAPLIVFIDSIVVAPCLRVTSGTCACANLLWAVVSGGMPPYSYSWSPQGGTGDSVVGACYEEWTVTVTDANNCLTGDSLNVVVPENVIDTVSTAAGVKQINNEQSVHLYPNPANSQINISLKQAVTGTQTLAVYDVLGRKVLARQFSGSNLLVTLDVSGLSEGSYLLTITGEASQEKKYFSVSR